MPSKRTVRYTIEPMTLGNMRGLGVRSLAVWCTICRHEAIIDAQAWPDDREPTTTEV
jgi:hypothetical protein